MQISVWHEMFLPILLHLINITFLPNNLLWQRRCDCDLDGMKEPFFFDLLQSIDCRYLKGNLLWFLIFLSYQVHHFFPLCYRDKFGSIKICPPMFLKENLDINNHHWKISVAHYKQWNLMKQPILNSFLILRLHLGFPMISLPKTCKLPNAGCHLYVSVDYTLVFMVNIYH